MQLERLTVPVIDISPFSVTPPVQSELDSVTRQIYAACTDWGFFQIVGHGIDLTLQKELVRCAEEFFNQAQEDKLALHVKKGGVAWRGYMPHGGEGTHGRTDHKEGLYAGPEHPDDHRHAGMPLHGKNQFPDSSIPAMRPTVLKYIDEVTALGKNLSDIISLSLGLEKDYIRDHYLQPEPIALFRCFKYSTDATSDTSSANGQIYGIGEHTGKCLSASNRW